MTPVKQKWVETDLQRNRVELGSSADSDLSRHVFQQPVCFPQPSLRRRFFLRSSKQEPVVFTDSHLLFAFALGGLTDGCVSIDNSRSRSLPCRRCCSSERKNWCFFSFIKVQTAWRQNEKSVQSAWGSAGGGDDCSADSASPPSGLCVCRSVWFSVFLRQQLERLSWKKVSGSRFRIDLIHARNWKWSGDLRRENQTWGVVRKGKRG